MGLLNLRNALMAGKRLPYDAEVEYIATTGGQYINTSIIGSSATKVEITAYSTNTTDYMSLFGARNANNSNRPSYSIWQKSSVAGGMRMRFDYNSASADSLAGGDWNASTVNTITKDNVSNYINGTLVSTNTARSFSLDIPFYLGTINGSGTPATYYFVGRIYSCKIWDANGNLVFDGIPVRVGTTGYLYDRVSGKLFGNAGTGDFVVGPDVVPVEYIESHGTEYIDTGVIPDDSTGVEIVHTICAGNSRDNIIFGARQDSGQTRYWCDVDWTDYTIGWGFNAYSLTAYRFALKPSDVGRVITNSLNYMNDRAGKIDGVIYDSSIQDKVLTTLSRSIYLFAANLAGSASYPIACKMSSVKISKGQTLANKFLPVRVGTGSTWEGAMIDTLTRRIYRNAGTGAFGYGNDLKYPIPA